MIDADIYLNKTRNLIQDLSKDILYGPYNKIMVVFIKSLTQKLSMTRNLISNLTDLVCVMLDYDVMGFCPPLL